MLSSPSTRNEPALCFDMYLALYNVSRDEFGFNQCVGEMGIVSYGYFYLARRRFKSVLWSRITLFIASGTLWFARIAIYMLLWSAFNFGTGMKIFC